MDDESGSLSCSYCGLEFPTSTGLQRHQQRFCPATRAADGGIGASSSSSSSAAAKARRPYYPGDDDSSAGHRNRAGGGAARGRRKPGNDDEYGNGEGDDDDDDSDNLDRSGAFPPRDYVLGAAKNKNSNSKKRSQQQQQRHQYDGDDDPTPTPHGHRARSLGATSTTGATRHHRSGGDRYYEDEAKSGLSWEDENSRRRTGGGGGGGRRRQASEGEGRGGRHRRAGDDDEGYSDGGDTGLHSSSSSAAAAASAFSSPIHRGRERRRHGGDDDDDDDDADALSRFSSSHRKLSANKSHSKSHSKSNGGSRPSRSIWESWENDDEDDAAEGKAGAGVDDLATKREEITLRLERLRRAKYQQAANASSSSTNNNKDSTGEGTSTGTGTGRLASAGRSSVASGSASGAASSSSSSSSQPQQQQQQAQQQMTMVLGADGRYYPTPAAQAQAAPAPLPLPLPIPGYYPPQQAYPHAHQQLQYPGFTAPSPYQQQQPHPQAQAQPAGGVAMWPPLASPSPSSLSSPVPMMPAPAAAGAAAAPSLPSPTQQQQRASPKPAAAGFKGPVPTDPVGIMELVSLATANGKEENAIAALMSLPKALQATDYLQSQLKHLLECRDLRLEKERIEKQRELEKARLQLAKEKELSAEEVAHEKFLATQKRLVKEARIKKALMKELTRELGDDAVALQENEEGFNGSAQSSPMQQHHQSQQQAPARMTGAGAAGGVPPLGLHGNSQQQQQYLQQQQQQQRMQQMQQMQQLPPPGSSSAALSRKPSSSLHSQGQGQGQGQGGGNNKSNNSISSAASAITAHTYGAESRKTAGSVPAGLRDGAAGPQAMMMTPPPQRGKKAVTPLVIPVPSVDDAEGGMAAAALAAAQADEQERRAKKKARRAMEAIQAAEALTGGSNSNHNSNNKMAAATSGGAGGIAASAVNANPSLALAVAHSGAGFSSIPAVPVAGALLPANHPKQRQQEINSRTLHDLQYTATAVSGSGSAYSGPLMLDPRSTHSQCPSVFDLIPPAPPASTVLKQQQLKESGVVDLDADPYLRLYQPETGLHIMFDLLEGLPSKATMVQVAYCFYCGSEAVGTVQVLPPVKTQSQVLNLPLPSLPPPPPPPPQLPQLEGTLATPQQLAQSLGKGPLDPAQAQKYAREQEEYQRRLAQYQKEMQTYLQQSGNYTCAPIGEQRMIDGDAAEDVTVVIEVQRFVLDPASETSASSTASVLPLETKEPALLFPAAPGWPGSAAAPPNAELRSVGWTALPLFRLMRHAAAAEKRQAERDAAVRRLKSKKAQRKLQQQQQQQDAQGQGQGQAATMDDQGAGKVQLSGLALAVGDTLDNDTETFTAFGGIPSSSCASMAVFMAKRKKDRRSKRSRRNRSNSKRTGTGTGSAIDAIEEEVSDDEEEDSDDDDDESGKDEDDPVEITDPSLISGTISSCLAVPLFKPPVAMKEGGPWASIKGLQPINPCAKVYLRLLTHAQFERINGTAAAVAADPALLSLVSAASAARKAAASALAAAQSNAARAVRLATAKMIKEAAKRAVEQAQMAKVAAQKAAEAEAARLALAAARKNSPKGSKKVMKAQAAAATAVAAAEAAAAAAAAGPPLPGQNGGGGSPLFSGNGSPIGFGTGGAAARGEAFSLVGFPPSPNNGNAGNDVRAIFTEPTLSSAVVIPNPLLDPSVVAANLAAQATASALANGVAGTLMSNVRARELALTLLLAPSPVAVLNAAVQSIRDERNEDERLKNEEEARRKAEAAKEEKERLEREEYYKKKGWLANAFGGGKKGKEKEAAAAAAVAAAAAKAASDSKDGDGKKETPEQIFERLNRIDPPPKEALLLASLLLPRFEHAHLYADARACMEEHHRVLAEDRRLQRERERRERRRAEGKEASDEEDDGASDEKLGSDSDDEDDEDDNGERGSRGRGGDGRLSTALTESPPSSPEPEPEPEPPAFPQYYPSKRPLPDDVRGFPVDPPPDAPANNEKKKDDDDDDEDQGPPVWIAVSNPPAGRPDYGSPFIDPLLLAAMEVTEGEEPQGAAGVGSGSGSGSGSDGEGDGSPTASRTNSPTRSIMSGTATATATATATGTLQSLASPVLSAKSAAPAFGAKGTAGPNLGKANAAAGATTAASATGVATTGAAGATATGAGAGTGAGTGTLATAKSQKTLLLAADALQSAAAAAAKTRTNPTTTAARTTTGGGDEKDGEEGKASRTATGTGTGAATGTGAGTGGGQGRSWPGSVPPGATATATGASNAAATGANATKTAATGTAANKTATATGASGTGNTTSTALVTAQSQQQQQRQQQLQVTIAMPPLPLYDPVRPHAALNARWLGSLPPPSCIPSWQHPHLHRFQGSSTNNSTVFDPYRDGFDIYVDGARFLPDNVSISKVVVKVMSHRFTPIGSVTAFCGGPYNLSYANAGAIVTNGGGAVGTAGAGGGGGANNNNNPATAAAAPSGSQQLITAPNLAGAGGSFPSGGAVEALADLSSEVLNPTFSCLGRFAPHPVLQNGVGSGDVDALRASGAGLVESSLLGIAGPLAAGCGPAGVALADSWIRKQEQELLALNMQQQHKEAKEAQADGGGNGGSNNDDALVAANAVSSGVSSVLGATQGLPSPASAAAVATSAAIRTLPVASTAPSSCTLVRFPGPIDPTATVLIRIDALESHTHQLQCVGYACFNLFTLAGAFKSDTAPKPGHSVILNSSNGPAAGGGGGGADSSNGNNAGGGIGGGQLSPSSPGGHGSSPLSAAAKHKGKIVLKKRSIADGTTSPDVSYDPSLPLVLNSGAFQLPLHQAPPSKGQPLTTHCLDRTPRVPCATVLIRVAHNKNIRDAKDTILLQPHQQSVQQKEGPSLQGAAAAVSAVTAFAFGGKGGKSSGNLLASPGSSKQLVAGGAAGASGAAAAAITAQSMGEAGLIAALTSGPPPPPPLLPVLLPPPSYDSRVYDSMRCVPLPAELPLYPKRADICPPTGLEMLVRGYENGSSAGISGTVVQGPIVKPVPVQVSVPVPGAIPGATLTAATNAAGGAGGGAGGGVMMMTKTALLLPDTLPADVVSFGVPPDPGAADDDPTGAAPDQPQQPQQQQQQSATDAQKGCLPALLKLHAALYPRREIVEALLNAASKEHHQQLISLATAAINNAAAAATASSSTAMVVSGSGTGATGNGTAGIIVTASGTVLSSATAATAATAAGARAGTASVAGPPAGAAGQAATTPQRAGTAASAAGAAAAGAAGAATPSRSVPPIIAVTGPPTPVPTAPSVAGAAAAAGAGAAALSRVPTAGAMSAKGGRQTTGPGVAAAAQQLPELAQLHSLLLQALQPGPRSQASSAGVAVMKLREWAAVRLHAHGSLLIALGSSQAHGILALGANNSKDAGGKDGGRHGGGGGRRDATPYGTSGGSNSTAITSQSQQAFYYIPQPPSGMLDYTFITPYDPQAGFKVRVDGVHGLVVPGSAGNAGVNAAVGAAANNAATVGGAGGVNASGAGSMALASPVVLNSAIGLGASGSGGASAGGGGAGASAAGGAGGGIVLAKGAAPVAAVALARVLHSVHPPGSLYTTDPPDPRTTQMTQTTDWNRSTVASQRFKDGYALHLGVPFHPHLCAVFDVRLVCSSNAISASAAASAALTGINPLVSVASATSPNANAAGNGRGGGGMLASRGGAGGGATSTATPAAVGGRVIVPGENSGLNLAVESCAWGVLPLLDDRGEGYIRRGAFIVPLYVGSPTAEALNFLSDLSRPLEDNIRRLILPQAASSSTRGQAGGRGVMNSTSTAGGMLPPLARLMPHGTCLLVRIHDGQLSGIHSINAGNYSSAHIDASIRGRYELSDSVLNEAAEAASSGMTAIALHAANNPATVANGMLRMGGGGRGGYGSPASSSKGFGSPRVSRSKSTNAIVALVSNPATPSQAYPLAVLPFGGSLCDALLRPLGSGGWMPRGKRGVNTEAYQYLLLLQQKQREKSRLRYKRKLQRRRRRERMQAQGKFDEEYDGDDRDDDGEEDEESDDSEDSADDEVAANNRRLATMTTNASIPLLALERDSNLVVSEVTGVKMRKESGGVAAAAIAAGTNTGANKKH